MCRGPTLGNLISFQIAQLVAERGGLFIIFCVDGFLQFAPETEGGDLTVGIFGLLGTGDFADVLGGTFLGALQ